MLVKERKARKMTQMELAERVGRPQSDISKMERGTRRIDLVEFVVIARAIGCDPHMVIDEIDKLVVVNGTKL